MDSLVYWMIGATIVGARLGHVFFYDWDKYKNNLGDILKVWEGDWLRTEPLSLS